MSEISYRSDMGVELVQFWGTDELVARAARVSTNRDLLEQGKIEGLIGYLIRNGHMSPLAHVGATFRVEAPLFVRDQMVRHKFLDPNIQSLRFSEAKPEFYTPGLLRPLFNAGSGAHPDLRLNHPDGRPLHRVVRDEVEISSKQAWISYRNMIEFGVAEEVARGVLPTNLYTSAYWTSNLWGWMNFLEKRIESEDNRPQYEVEVVAKAVLEELERLFPVTMGAWGNTK